MEYKFDLGRIVATANAQGSINSEDMLKSLSRHASGDWGEVCDDDRVLNDQALEDGTRLLSVYTDQNNVKFWIITEADRSVTTILLPEDY